MTVSEKIKIIDNKIKQNKVQHNIDRQTAKISDFHQDFIIILNF